MNIIRVLSSDPNSRRELIDSFLREGLLEAVNGDRRKKTKSKSKSKPEESGDDSSASPEGSNKESGFADMEVPGMGSSRRAWYKLLPLWEWPDKSWTKIRLLTKPVPVMEHRSMLRKPTKQKKKLIEISILCVKWDYEKGRPNSKVSCPGCEANISLSTAFLSAGIVRSLQERKKDKDYIRVFRLPATLFRRIKVLAGKYGEPHQKAGWDIEVFKDGSLDGSLMYSAERPDDAASKLSAKERKLKLPDISGTLHSCLPEHTDWLDYANSVRDKKALLKALAKLDKPSSKKGKSKKESSESSMSDSDSEDSGSASFSDSETSSSASNSDASDSTSSSDSEESSSSESSMSSGSTSMSSASDSVPPKKSKKKEDSESSDSESSSSDSTPPPTSKKSKKPKEKLAKSPKKSKKSKKK